MHKAFPLGIILFLFYLVLLSLLIYKAEFYRLPGIRRGVTLFLFFVKMLAGAALILIYSHYYTEKATADIFRFFEDGRVITGAWFDSPAAFFKLITSSGLNDPALADYINQMNHWEMSYDYGMYTDNRTVIRINGISGLISAGFYPTHALFFIFISFTGSAALYRAFYKWFSPVYFLPLIATFLVPSLLLWTSGILKESILLAGMGLLILGAVKLATERKASGVAVLLCGILVLLTIKIYILLILVLPLLIFIFTAGKPRLALAANGLMIVAALILFFNSGFTGYDLPGMISRKYHDAVNEALHTGAGSFIQTRELLPEASSFFLKLPEALFNSMFRPLPWEAEKFAGIIAAIENLIPAILILSLIYIRPKISGSDIPFLLFLLISSAAIMALAGMVTPVLGTLVRYKTPALPMLYTAIFLMIIRSEKFRNLNLKWLEKLHS